MQLQPGTRNNTTCCKTGWTLENEIAWQEHYIEQNILQLARLYAERAWWERFLIYCNTPTFF